MPGYELNFGNIFTKPPNPPGGFRGRIFLLQRYTAVLKYILTTGGAAMGNQNNKQIMKSFKKKKILNYIITLVVFAVGFFAFWFANNRDYFSNENTRVYIAYLICAAAIGGLAASIINWRCPACKKYMGRSMDPRICRKCGAKLQ
jgi:hypothetical protein